MKPENVVRGSNQKLWPKEVLAPGCSPCLLLRCCPDCLLSSNLTSLQAHKFQINFPDVFCVTFIVQLVSLQLDQSNSLLDSFLSQILSMIFHNSFHQLVSLQMDQSNSLFIHEFLQNLSPASFSPNGSIKQPLLNLSSEGPCSLFTRGCHQFVETQR